MTQPSPHSTGNRQDRPYVVIGPQRTAYSFGMTSEPPEPDRVWVGVQAPTRAAAIQAAARQDHGVRDLMNEARGDNVHPYTYLRVLLSSPPDAEDCSDCPPVSDDDEAEWMPCPRCRRFNERIDRAITGLDVRFGS